MNHPGPVTADEAASVTAAALGLAGYEVHPFTWELTAKMARGELTGDQAVTAIITRFLDAP